MSELSTGSWAVLAAGVAVLAWGILTYNRLIALRQRAREGWSGIDVQLKRRSNLVPNLVNTVKGYVRHERETLEAVTEMRARVQAADSAGPAAREQAEGALTAALTRLFAVAENYPELKADGNFVELQAALGDLENQIQMARRYYNGTVRDLNTQIESFPSNLIAGWFRFQMLEYFEIENAGDRAVPDVSF